jgi:hypothetical protein
VSNTFAWRCSTSSVLIPFFTRHLANSTSHLDIGPGTGLYTSQNTVLAILNKLKHLSFLDINPTPLHHASQRTITAGYKGPQIQLIQHSVFEPLPKEHIGAYDSISLNYILHCLPGCLPLKASHVATTLLPALVQSPDSVLYGSTILGRGVHKTWFARFLFGVYNPRGIFSNLDDDEEGLKAGLAPYFEEVDVKVEGMVALFVCKGPKGVHLM